MTHRVIGKVRLVAHWTEAEEFEVFEVEYFEDDLIYRDEMHLTFFEYLSQLGMDYGFQEDVLTVLKEKYKLDDTIELKADVAFQTGYCDCDECEDEYWLEDIKSHRLSAKTVEEILSRKEEERGIS